MIDILEKKIRERGLEVMPDNKFDYLDKLINELSENEKFIVLVFMLKCQEVEYGLKFLLGWYPWKSQAFLKKNFLEKATMGQTLNKIREIDDSHLDGIIEDAEIVIKLRNEVTHNLLTTKKSTNEIEHECRENLYYADHALSGIHYLMDFAEHL
ncbi:hypothetical protein KKG24_01860 [Patescibacteria group bacterium]|nr:hypothetical protein [Patescibacteria group bacterium]